MFLFKKKICQGFAFHLLYYITTSPSLPNPPPHPILSSPSSSTNPLALSVKLNQRSQDEYARAQAENRCWGCCCCCCCSHAGPRLASTGLLCNHALLMLLLPPLLCLCLCLCLWQGPQRLLWARPRQHKHRQHTLSLLDSRSPACSAKLRYGGGREECDRRRELEPGISLTHWPLRISV